jgi:hypothetical protein
MRTIVFIILATCIWNYSGAQDSVYLQMMEENIAKTDSAKTSADWLNVANTMERIANKETDKWHPAYYASLSYLMTGLFTENKKEQSAYYDKALEWVLKCEGISGIDSSEVLVLKSQVWSMQISLQPAKLGRTLGPLSDAALKNALRINPENPRAYMLRGQNFYYSPPMFGGDKDKACEDFVLAKEKFEKFVPESKLSPQWGYQYVLGMIEECQSVNE